MGVYCILYSVTTTTTTTTTATATAAAAATTTTTTAYYYYPTSFLSFFYRAPYHLSKKNISPDLNGSQQSCVLLVFLNRR